MSNESELATFWRWQTHFRISATVCAEELFRALDPDLDPKFILVGVAGEIPSNPLLIPEVDEHGWVSLDPSTFGTRYAWHRENDPERNTAYSNDEEAVLRLKELLPMLAIERAIRDLLAAGPLANSWVFFTRPAIRVAAAVAVPVLALAKAAINSHPRLTKTSTWNGAFDASGSLIDAAAEVFMSACAAAFRDDKNWRIELNVDEALRRAGDALMYVPSAAGGDREGVHGLFATINAISALNYEGEPARGTMVIAPHGHPSVEIGMRFVEPISLRHYRASRKLLQMSSESIAVIADNANAHGLGSVRLYDSSREDMFQVRFINHYRWELVHDGNIIMRVAYGLPALPHPQIERSAFDSLAKRVLGPIAPDAMTVLWELVEVAARQRRGTLVVVSADARSEASRLAGQAIPISAARLTTQLLDLGTSIDGALLFDREGYCHAVGAILDGRATAQGSPARGARYNSAVRYVQSSGVPCITIVFSEDGTVDLLPALRSQISRAELNMKASALLQMEAAPTASARDFHRLMSWLREREFYIGESLCAELNRAWVKIDERLRNASPDSIHFVYDDFAPDPNMNDSYFLEE